VTIIGIKIAGYDFNIFSLGGMAAAVGGLIDHLVIVIENIERHFQEEYELFEDCPADERCARKLPIDAQLPLSYLPRGPARRKCRLILKWLRVFSSP
jgi:hypothetical protein